MSNITPPPELVEQWISELDRPDDPRWQEYEQDIADRAAHWGADQELDACCAWLDSYHAIGHSPVVAQLRAWRRPKPPSLNSTALQMLGTIERDAHYLPEITDTIRRALEALPND